VAPVDEDAWRKCGPQLASADTTFCLSDDDPTRLHAFPLVLALQSESSVRFVITLPARNHVVS
jgi:hypothetical protein